MRWLTRMRALLRRPGYPSSGALDSSAKLLRSDGSEVGAFSGATFMEEPRVLVALVDSACMGGQQYKPVGSINVTVHDSSASGGASR